MRTAAWPGRSELFAVFELYHKQNDVHIVEVLTNVFSRAIALGYDGPVYVPRASILRCNAFMYSLTHSSTGTLILNGSLQKTLDPSVVAANKVRKLITHVHIFCIVYARTHSLTD